MLGAWDSKERPGCREEQGYQIVGTPGVSRYERNCGVG